MPKIGTGILGCRIGFSWKPPTQRSHLSIRERCIAVSLALTGILVCGLGVLAFFTNFMNNTIPWNAGQSMRSHYMAIGEYYGQGFLTGFFLCFFLTLIALACWNGARRSRPSLP